MTTTILVIDDSADDQRLYRRAFKDFESSFTLVMASSAADGFARIADASPDPNRPDLILLDYNLPDMDGLSFIRRLAEYSDNFIPIPIIMLTGEGNAAVAVEAMKNGVNDYIVKDTGGQYLKLLPGVAGHVMAAHAQREQSLLLKQEAETLLRRNQTLMQNSMDGIHVMNMRGNIVEANDAFCRMLGYTREEAARLNVADWDAQWSAEELWERFKDHIVNRSRFETQHRRKDGSLIDVEVSTSGMEIEGQYFVFAASRDITERKKTEAALKRHKQVIDTSLDGFWINDLQGNLLEANQAYATMSGYSIEELANMHISQLEAKEQATDIKAHTEKIFAQGYDRFVTRHRRKDGRVIDVEVSATYIAEAQQIFAFFRDITERNQAEEKLKLGMQLLDSTSDSVFLFDLDGHFVFLNEAAWKSRGYTRDEMMAMKLSELNTPEFRKLIAPRIKELLENGQGIYESEHFCKDGSIISVEISSRVIESGGRKLVLAAIRDITERKQSEEALRVAAVTFETHDAIIITDADVNIIQVNKAFSDITGYRAEEVLGRNPRIMSSGRHDRAFYAAMWQQLLNTGSWSGEIWDKRKNGEIYPKWMTITAVKNERQEIIRYISISSDITARVQAEEELLRESDERFRGTLEQAAVGIAHADLDGTYLKTNQKLCEILGFSPDELVRLNVRDVTFPEDMDKDIVYMRQLLAGEISTFAVEKRYVRKNQSQVWVQLTVSLLRHSEGSPKYFIFVVEDITARKAAERRILRINELYAVISRANEAIVRIAERDKLLGEICRIAVEFGRFKLAWVGLMDGATRDLKVVASSGEATGYLDDFYCTADTDRPEGRGPTGMAIRNNREYVCNDFLNDPDTLPWRENARKYGLRANASYPLELDGQVTGALTLYADEVNYFDQDMTNLLIVLAKDISLALNNFVRKDRRRRAELELAESRQLLRELVAQSETLREEERKHIAREIHDELGQILTALRMDVGLLRLKFGEQNAVLLKKVQDITVLLDRAIQGVRNVTSNLRPTALDMGIVSAIEWLRDEFVKHTGVPCIMRLTEDQIDLDEALAMVVFRIVQESLTNIARHAEASHVTISLLQGANVLHVIVRDNGKGFDPANATRRKSFGLLGMRERAIALGGTVDIASKPQHGTTVSLRIPTKPENGDLSAKHTENGTEENGGI